MPAVVVAAVVAAAATVYSVHEQKAMAADNRNDMANQNAANLAAQKANTPTVMPTPDDKAVQEAQQASIISQMSNRGRASTILTDQNDSQKLGG